MLDRGAEMKTGYLASIIGPSSRLECEFRAIRPGQSIRNSPLSTSHINYSFLTRDMLHWKVWRTEYRAYRRESTCLEVFWFFLWCLSRIFIHISFYQSWLIDHRIVISRTYHYYYLLNHDSRDSYLGEGFTSCFCRYSVLWIPRKQSLISSYFAVTLIPRESVGEDSCYAVILWY